MKTPPAPPLLIQNGTLILPDRLIADGAVLCERGKIKAVGKGIAAPKNAVVMDAKGGYISPGFIDIHVHGGAGADFMDGTVPAVRNTPSSAKRRPSSIEAPESAKASAKVASM